CRHGTETDGGGAQRTGAHDVSPASPDAAVEVPQRGSDEGPGVLLPGGDPSTRVHAVPAGRAAQDALSDPSRVGGAPASTPRPQGLSHGRGDRAGVHRGRRSSGRRGSLPELSQGSGTGPAP